MPDWKRAIHITVCPAAECESRVPPHRITAERFPDLWGKLEAVTSAQTYDYYHCQGQCKRIWRIERHDRVHGEPYREPEYIGGWDSEAGGDAVVFQNPQPIVIRTEFLQSRTDPYAPAKSKRDARLR